MDCFLRYPTSNPRENVDGHISGVTLDHGFWFSEGSLSNMPNMYLCIMYILYVLCISNIYGCMSTNNEIKTVLAMFPLVSFIILLSVMS